jgi:hypothetical protein
MLLNVACHLIVHIPKRASKYLMCLFEYAVSYDRTLGSINVLQKAKPVTSPEGK